MKKIYDRLSTYTHKQVYLKQNDFSIQQFFEEEIYNKEYMQLEDYVNIVDDHRQHIE